MRKYLVALLIALVAFVPVAVQADAGNVYTSGTITATDTSGAAGSQLQLSGHNQCQVTFAGTFSGLTVVGQVASDYPQGTNGAYHWATAAAPLNSMSPSNGTSYIGTVSDKTLNGWQLHVTAFGSGTAYYYEVCSTASPAGSSGGGNVTITNPLGAHGGVQIEGVASGVPIPISGSVTATTTFPYGAGAQSATSASFLGAAGVFNTSLPTLTNGQVAGIQFDSSGRLIVNGSTVTQPVSGTTACSNCGPPYGMATQGQTATGGSGVGVLGTYFSGAAPTLTNAQVNPLALDVNGNLLVDLNTAIPAGANSIGFFGIKNGSNQLAVDANGVTAAKVCDKTTTTQCASISAAGVVSVSTPAPLPTTAAGALQTGLCDKTTLTQCAAVSAAGVVSVSTPAPSPTTAAGALQTALCDKTTLTQCVAVSSAGAVSISGTAGLLGATSTFACCTASSNTVVKASAGRFYGLIITTAFTVTNLVCFDNASTNSGTIIYEASTTAALGAVLQAPALGIPFANGLTCSQGAVGAATLYYQ